MSFIQSTSSREMIEVAQINDNKDIGAIHFDCSRLSFRAVRDTFIPRNGYSIQSFGDNLYKLFERAQVRQKVNDNAANESEKN